MMAGGRIIQQLLRRNLQYQSPVYITSVPVGISLTWPFFTALSDFFISLKLVTTYTSLDEVKVTDETLNQVLSVVENSSSDREVCNLIYQFCRAGSVSALANLIRSLHHRRLFLSVNAYNMLLEAASQRNDIDLSLEIFKDMLMSNRASSKSFFHLARAFAKLDDCDQLLKFVGEVSKSTFPWSPILVNRIMYALAECGNADKALTIFDAMASLECKPDVFTYNIILGILGDRGRVNDMLIKFASMKEASVSPDLVTYNTLINNFRKFCRLDLCMMCWREMVENGIQPDLRTYTSLIDILGRCGNIGEALKLFNEMKCRQIQRSVYIYRSLIDSMKMMGNLEAVASLQEEMMSCMSDLLGPKDFKRKKR